LRKDLQ
jgi:hypothetical protein